jgi:predicted Fe-Mo cluster-binding NifX family protein
MMETIAITTWNGIISPLYDAACQFLIVRPDGSQSVVDVRDRSLVEKATLCSTQAVAVLICGAISDVAFGLLADNGIRVLCWMRGPVAEVIEAYRGKRDLSELYAMPGCKGHSCAGTKRFKPPGARCGVRSAAARLKKTEGERANTVCKSPGDGEAKTSKEKRR